MEQQPMTPPVKKPSALRRVSVIALILLALVIIGASIFTLMNPNGVETNVNDESASVTIKQDTISPTIMKIKQGQTITWINESEAPRQLIVTSSDPQQELEGFGDDEQIAQDESYSFTFDKAGSYTYEDPNAPEQINGTIIVE